MKIPNKIWLGAPIKPVECQEEKEKEKKHKDVKIYAYSGGLAYTSCGPMVFSLDGMQCNDKIALLLRHDRSLIAGYTTKITKANGVHVLGRCIKEAKAGKEVIDLMDAEFPWQASVGLILGENGIQYVAEGEIIKVNGQEFAGPLIAVLESTLQEVSFVPFGADNQTYAIAASSDDDVFYIDLAKGEKTMPEKKEKKDAASLDELRSAFPDNPQFVLEQLSAGSSMTEARLAFLERENKRLAEEAEKAKKDAELAEAKQACSAPTPVSARFDEPQGEDKNPIQEWKEEIGTRAARIQARHAGMSYHAAKKQAVLEIDRDMPDLRQAYISEYNKVYGDALLQRRGE